MQEKKVVFSDLDGTLLNNKYSFESAGESLEILKEQEIPLILVSSKTMAEIEFYRKKLENNHPFISENGGAIFIPKNYFFKENKEKLKRLKGLREKYKVVELGVSYKKLVSVLGKIKKKIFIKGFSDMSGKELSKDSGLSLKQAKLAKKREYDEAFKLENKKDEKIIFKLIKKHGLNYTKGGKYYHILGDNDKGKAVEILKEFYKKKYGKVFAIGLGDSENDLPMFRVVNKSFLIKGPKEWNKIIIKSLGMDNEFVKRGEEVFKESKRVLKKFQFSNGAILASPPKGRYPYIYPRDHAICILSLIDCGEFGRAKKALNFILKTQNKEGSFPQRLNKKGKDVSYKPIQLDNTGLVLYAFAKYIQEFKDKKFLIENRGKISRGVKYIKNQLDKKKNLFFTPNSIHEFPPLEKGLEIWVNAVCYGALEELEKIKIKSIDLKKIKKSIKRYFWNGKYFIKNIRLNESSSAVSEIDASSYALADFGVFDDKNEMIKKTVSEIEKELWHKKIGGICRYREYIGRNNGGWGAWPHFTLMICRHFIKIGNRKKANEYLNWVMNIACDNLLPEHIALKKDFEKWVNEYKRAGLFRKDREIMIKNIRKSKMFCEKGLAYSVLPLTWPHAEFIRTWGLYRKKFL